MSIERMFVHDIQIRRSDTGTDRYGNTVRPWSTFVMIEPSVGGWLTQTGQTELRDQRAGEVTTWRLYLPPQTDIVAGDRVVWQIDAYETMTFEVDAPPVRPWTPNGEHHVEVDLRVVEG